MNWAVLRILYVHELKMLIRARRTVVMAIVIPALIMPLMLFAQKYANDRRQRALTGTTYQYAVTGQLAERARSLIEKTKQDIAQNQDARLVALRQFKFLETQTDDPRKSLDENAIHFYIEAIPGEVADKRLVPTPPSPPSAAGKRLKGVPLLNVIYRGDRDNSDTAHDRMMALLRRARDQDSRSLLTAQGFTGDPTRLFSVSDSNMATHGQITGSLIGRFITLFLVMMMFTGGAVAAMDIIAGEKERGTLETLLTTAVGRTEIVTAKQLAITSVALVITLIQGLNFFIYVKLKVIALPQNFDLQLPTGMALTLLMLFIPLAATIGSILLMISAYAKSYKEAQMYFFPIYLVSLIPSLASIMPGVSLRSAIAFVPLANVSVASREILMGRPDPIMILVTFGVMVLAATYLMRASARMLSREDIVIPAHFEPAEFLGGPALFQKRVLRWFALMWAVTFAVASNVPQLATFRRQLLFNEIIIMIGATLLMMKVYRLDPKEVLNLRRVKPAVWLGVLFAIPAGNVAALAIFQLVNTVIPAPQQLLERFTSDIIPPGMPTWHLLLYIAVLPAICEELAFRGVLLSGLRRKLRPVALVLVVGVIFGFFHISLFRIAPTAIMGMVLTVLALMTGSVFPGMLLHFGNNALSVVAGETLNPSTLQWPHYTAGIAIFALSFWIIYRNRTPMPTR